jgi:hypothetical protein
MLSLTHGLAPETHATRRNREEIVYPNAEGAVFGPIFTDGFSHLGWGWATAFNEAFEHLQMRAAVKETPMLASQRSRRDA